jgi:UDP-3-O-[3-hydroxymyristoyl] glucosamine N-acyltransferase
MKHYKNLVLKEIADILDGKIKGDSNFMITRLSEPDNYTKTSLILVKNPKKWIQKNADMDILPGCIILEKYALGNYGGNQIIVENYEKAFLKVLNLFKPKKSNVSSISEKAVLKSKNIGKLTTIEDYVTICKDAKIDDEVYIGCNTYIGENVIIGKKVKIFPNCIINDNTIIEDNVIIHSGAVIGSDGFGYIEIDNILNKVPQLGNVIIKKDAEIGANTCIDRATIGSTIIGENTKIDNLCQIAHNVKIGDNCIIVSQTGISGSCSIGNNCVIGGQVGISDHVTLESGTIIGSQSGVSKSSSKQSKYLLGTPARDMIKEKKIWAFLNKAPEILDRIRKLERKKH